MRQNTKTEQKMDWTAFKLISKGSPELVTVRSAIGRIGQLSTKAATRQNQAKQRPAEHPNRSGQVQRVPDIVFVVVVIARKPTVRLMALIAFPRVLCCLLWFLLLALSLTSSLALSLSSSRRLPRFAGLNSIGGIVP